MDCRFQRVRNGDQWYPDEVPRPWSNDLMGGYGVRTFERAPYDSTGLSEDSDMSGCMEGPEITYKDLGAVRTFDTGATRDTDEGKLDFEGFLSPYVLHRFAEYMHKHRTQADGTVRASDNWQLGIPISAYMKSMWRHFFDVWWNYRCGGFQEAKEEALCALMFNVQGMLHSLLCQPGSESASK
jgi:hypothetical protein